MSTIISRTKAIAIVTAWSCVTAVLSTQGQIPAVTITNPAPGIAKLFGQTVAAVGDSLLIGDPQDSTLDQYTGAVYLYNSSGALMRTFTNPAPANGYFFGFSLAAVGNDKVLIGAPLGAFPGATQPGAAYLFHTNGTLIRTFLRPSGGQVSARFGITVAALGSDRVVIGADADDRAGTDAGAAYLFSTNGTLLATLTNPAPLNFEYLGAALTVLGSDRILIGAPTTPGSAFLFNTNGAVLTKFNNPIPPSGGSFGQTVAALGTDLVAIGAPGANIMAVGGGVVYLFRTNGVLAGPALDNPDVTQGDAFGIAIAAVGTDKLLVGSFNQAAGQNAGAAYLFSTNRSLMMTIRNVSTNSDHFGTALAAITTDRALIGARFTAPAGAAYVFDLRPSLSILNAETNTAVVSWPSGWTGWTVQQSTNCGSTLWHDVSETVIDDGTSQSFLITSPGGNRFFRLTHP